MCTPFISNLCVLSSENSIPVMADLAEDHENQLKYLRCGHSDHLLKSINRLRKERKLCDITLTVGGKEFYAHRVILSASSDYFCAMFTGDMEESHKSVVELHGLDSDTMEFILDFVYTETIQVSVENVQPLLPAACLLQLTELSKAAEKYILKHFVELVDSEEFLQLGDEDLVSLIKCDNLTVPSEEAVFEALISWIKQDEVERKTLLPKMLEFKLIRQNLDCRDLVDEAKKYHLRPECRQAMQNDRTKPRIGLSEVIYVLGGFGNLQSPIDVVEKYDPAPNQWSIVQPMRRKRRYLSAVALNGRLYAIGGYDASSRLNTVECFDPSTSQWSAMTPMLQRRGLAGATTLAGKIFVAGGFDGTTRHTSVECYEPTIDRWTLVSEMQAPREGAGLAHLDGALYCVGGYDGNSILNSIERFDPRTGQWTGLSPMSTRRSGAGIVVLDGQLFAVGGYDGSQHLSSVECYSPCNDQWMNIANMKSNRCYVGTAVVCGKLFAVGGYDGLSLLDTCESYDPSIQEWTLITSMATSRCDMGVAVLLGQ
ncbi:Kelch-like protein 12 [Stylophora pistillata]|uniref:Kelch-like protein 12 n=1 Tax=Stylophora pistillata TaxID=50429 RepID=A0A2B4RN90_STYPI|nr:Kelch-like protein 12 [Stylophora pistillata]